jgi:hypothetical protein
MQPFEIVMSPANVYVALEGETPPAVNAVPGGNWVLLGVAGMRDQATEGVKITHNETLKFQSTAGATGSVKALRTMEEVIVEVSMYDLTPETYAKAMNLAGIREVAAASGVAGYRSFGGKQGFDVQTWSLLVRLEGVSPYGDGMNTQWYFPKVVENGQVALTFDSEGTVAGLNFKYTALCDPNAASDSERFFIYTAQTAAALP